MVTITQFSRLKCSALRGTSKNICFNMTFKSRQTPPLILLAYNRRNINKVLPTLRFLIAQVLNYLKPGGRTDEV